MNKKTAPLFVGIIIVALITITVSRVSGHLFGRWGTFPGQDVASAELKKLPMQIGYWHAEEEDTLDNSAISMLRIQNAYIARRYKHATTQEVVHLTLMVGPTGKITVHTPEVCFGGRDYEKEATRVSVPITVQLADGKEVADAFWRVKFVGRSAGDANNRISFYYAISVGDAWNAIENPRATFQKYRYVYKLQAQARSTSNEEDSAKKFLEECLPTIHEHLRTCY
jgi:hypothetical protein